MLIICFSLLLLHCNINEYSLNIFGKRKSQLLVLSVVEVKSYQDSG